MTDKSSFIKLSFKANADQQDMLIALLSDYGFDGFETHNDHLMGYISSERFNHSEVRALLSIVDIDLESYVETIDAQNWNSLWESNYPPIRLGDFCYIRAPFHPMLKEGEVKYELLIEPQMSFGTGHHETTQLMLEMMKAIDMTGNKILDVGCGTGILGILSAKMGAKSVWGLDISEWAIENAAENVRRNHVENMELMMGQATDIPTNDFDVILANINLGVLNQDIPIYVQHLTSGGTLLLSGFYQKDIEALNISLRQEGLTIIEQAVLHEWMAVKTVK